MSVTTLVNPPKNSSSEFLPDCILLSSGRSERLGHPKAFLPFSKNENFLEHIIRIYQQTGIHLIRVVVHPEMMNHAELKKMNTSQIIVNNEPERGRLYSLHCGLTNLETSEFCFIQNVDSPFLSLSILNQMKMHRKKADYVSPVYKGKGGHPILISAKVMQHIRNLTNFDQTLQDLLKIFSRENVIVDDPSVLVNINTPEDYQRYFQKT